MADRIGQQFDTYRLLRLLGTGGFGEVYLAEHLYHTTQVAIKILPPLAQDDLHDFLTEARTFRLKHPNIVQVLDFGVEGRTPFIVMEYAPNGTLRQRHPKGTRVSLPTIVSYVKQVASALQYAHDERLIHRDVKPENMLIGAQNQVLLTDFGIATIAHGSSSQSAETMAGTIPYMAPEQIQGHPHPASDQYSLGVVVYEWLCGDRPFHGTLTEVAIQQATVPPPPLHERGTTVSPDVEQVVMTALAKDRKQRFATVQAFAIALEQASQVSRDVAASLPQSLASPDRVAGLSQSQQPMDLAPPQSLSAGPTEWGLASAMPPQSSPQVLSPSRQTNRSEDGGDVLSPEGPAELPSASLSELPPSLSTPRLGHRRSVLVALLCLVLLVGAGGGGTWLYVTLQGQQRISFLTATATANANAQATAQANAQATIQANVAATATTTSAQAQATAGVIQTATAGQPAYSDPLTAGKVHDTTWTNDGTYCFFASDGYHVHVDTSTSQASDNAHFCTESDRPYQDATITVNMIVQGGYSGGLLFRFQNNLGYFFEVGAGGNYEIARWGVDHLQVWTDSPAIQQGLNSLNTLQVIAHGSDLRFYVNGVYLTQVQDATYGLGDIGFVCFTDTTGPGQAVFSNLNVYLYR